MIPKVIHYCWFGGKPKPQSVISCIKSWEKFCPDYKIVEWNEDNYDITKNKYMHEAWLEKKWAFVSDYSRLDIVYNHGGIYLDTDVELIKNIDYLLKAEAFMGFEDGKSVNTGLGFGAVKGFELIKELLELYENLDFINSDGSLNTVACPVYTTKHLISKGMKQNNSLQNIEGMTVYPSEYFSPKRPGNKKIRITPRTYSIHHYDMSWIDTPSKFINFKLRISPMLSVIRKIIVKIMGEENFRVLRSKVRRER